MSMLKKVTGLTRCLAKALGVGEAWGDKNVIRCKNSYHTLSGVAPILKVTPKDHKPIGLDGLPKDRSICEARSSQIYLPMSRRPNVK